ncbi:hypothetical protein MNEG_2807, partial [Monoraphidium neglectum]
IIDVIDCTGSGDVDTSNEVDADEDGFIIGRQQPPGGVGGSMCMRRHGPRQQGPQLSRDTLLGLHLD